ncbi:TetR/AcrR family transcriptional regulator C-terminal domain-containing protein [Paenibacillus sp. MMS20-IR301]|uniref:TetR/AcrR family transcriptional regulator n=1 Tax=Paenibacillus sp. MMS20-IR301 TaxID=2895946 RepID=UPI0028E67619|nr:TetR/AcrR family transcriptional regulator C-terminal domain-containing protein [Paenibacillus sp. MMS20-IR301]WNS44005.1 TetR/AcrR family transcriptional regulator C-terminal domain-containing protein [Paenibacillus sp. MMS20-IR301]
MNDKVDRRILRTRTLLRDVLLDLASEKTLESITVRELTEKAGLNRGTFYLHYKDIHDFYEQFKHELLEQFHALIKKLGHTPESQEPFSNPPSGYVRPFEYVLEQKRFFKVFMGRGGDSALSLQMTELINRQFVHAYKAKHRQTSSPEIPVKQEYLFAYLASAYVGTIQFWIQRDFDLSPADMTIVFSQISRLGSTHVNFTD